MYTSNMIIQTLSKLYRGNVQRVLMWIIGLSIHLLYRECFTGNRLSF